MEEHPPAFTIQTQLYGFHQLVFSQKIRAVTACPPLRTHETDRVRGRGANFT